MALKLGMGIFHANMITTEKHSLSQGTKPNESHSQDISHSNPASLNSKPIEIE